MKPETKIMKGMRRRYLETNGGIEQILCNKQRREDYTRFLTTLFEWQIKDSDVFKPKKNAIKERINKSN